MSSHPEIVDWARERNLSLIQHIDLGTTADVFILEGGGCKYALKSSCERHSPNPRLKTEYLLLKYLLQTSMEQYVPKVYEWVEELDGFMMEYLLYPDQEAKNQSETVQILARMLKVLHGTELPPAMNIPDDRPEIIQATIKRFSIIFQTVLENDTSWNTLPKEDLSRLGIVRKHFGSYSKLLTTLETTAVDAKAVLIHGDLAGDNIMMTQDGKWVLADWSEARISYLLSDIAYLFVYSGWSPKDIQQFIQLYFEKSEAELKRELSMLRVLSKLYRYRSCVQSLLWLREEGQGGLDAVGRENFERLLNAL
jgi:thiamine kinase-like enzyme